MCSKLLVNALELRGAGRLCGLCPLLVNPRLLQLSGDVPCTTLSLDPNCVDSCRIVLSFMFNPMPLFQSERGLHSIGVAPTACRCKCVVELQDTRNNG